jgi:hypothetical protein
MIGLGMILLPQLAPAWCGVVDGLGPSTRVLWLETMGLLQFGLGTVAGLRGLARMWITWLETLPEPTLAPVESFPVSKIAWQRSVGGKRLALPAA